MSLPSEKIPRPPLWREAVLFAAVAAFAAYSAKSVVAPKTSGPATIAQAEKLAPLGRRLAEIEKIETAPERSTRILEIGCLSAMAPSVAISPTTTQANLARIMAQECAPSQGVKARNEATGEDLVIFQNDKKISTHYFPLKEGVNRVVIDWTGARGLKLQRTIELVREIK